MSARRLLRWRDLAIAATSPARRLNSPPSPLLDSTTYSILYRLWAEHDEYDPRSYTPLANAITYSALGRRWEAIDPLLSSRFVAAILIRLRRAPALIPTFIARFNPFNIDLPTLFPCLSPFPPLLNLLLESCAATGYPHTAFDILSCMKDANIRPNIGSCNAILSVLREEGKDEKVRAFHKFMEDSGFCRPTAVSFNGYCSGGEVEWLDVMRGRGIEPDGYTYDILVSGMCEQGRLMEMTDDEMLHRGSSAAASAAATYNAIIIGHCRKGKLDAAFHCLNEMVSKGIEPTITTCNSLVHALFLGGRSCEDYNLIEEMEENGLMADATATTYNILISGYCMEGNKYKGHKLFEEMSRKGLSPNMVTCTSLIYVLSKRYRVEEADTVFTEVVEKGMSPDLMTYNALIEGHCTRRKNMKRAHQLLKEMDTKGVAPDVVTYNALMKGYSLFGQAQEARGLLDEMERRGIKPDHISYNTLIYGYSRRGEMKEALGVRDEMLSKGFNPTRLTYNAFIQALCENGEGDQAGELLKEMVSSGISPDDSTYVSLIEGLDKEKDERIQWVYKECW